MFKDPLLNQKLKQATRMLRKKRKNKNIITSAGIKLFKRKSKAYVIWRNYIFKKFGYKCYWCKSVKNLQVHHIEEWFRNRKKRIDKRNGVVLCISCHSLIHPFLRSTHVKNL